MLLLLYLFCSSASTLLIVLCDLCERSKVSRIVDSEVSQHLAVDVYAGNFKAVHHLAVGKTIQACACVDTGDPEFAEISSSLTSSCIGARERAHHGLFSDSVLF